MQSSQNEPTRGNLRAHFLKKIIERKSGVFCRKLIVMELYNPVKNCSRRSTKVNYWQILVNINENHFVNESFGSYFFQLNHSNPSKRNTAAYKKSLSIHILRIFIDGTRYLNVPPGKYNIPGFFRTSYYQIYVDTLSIMITL